MPPQASPAKPDRAPETTLHATVVGVDRPGVTARMFGALAGSVVLDVEQVVVAGQLVLGAVVLAPASSAAGLLAALHAAVPDFEVSVRQIHATDVSGAVSNARVTIVGRAVPARAIAETATRMAACGTNILRIDRVADYPVTVLALEVFTPDLQVLRHELTILAAGLSGSTQEQSEQPAGQPGSQGTGLGIDISVQPRALGRLGMHLVVMDVDSTLIQDEVIELLARSAGTEDEVRSITEAAMRGELDFAQSLHARVATLAGLPESAIAAAREQIRLTPGARTLCRTLRALGYRIALVSGGFTEVIAPLAESLGVDHLRANGLEIVDGHLTGRVQGPVIDRAAKATALREFAALHRIDPSQVIAIGDGANDLDMLAAAGQGIAFNAKPVVQRAADTAINVPYLDTVLYLMGISREDVEAATLPAPAVTDAGAHPASSGRLGGFRPAGGSPGRP